MSQTMAPFADVEVEQDGRGGRAQGRTQGGFEGAHQVQLGVWGGAVSPPAEPRKILKFTLFRG